MKKIKEFDFDKAQRGPRHDRNTMKIQKTFRIDYLSFEWLLKQRDRTGIPYQTLLNSILKMHIDEAERSLKEKMHPKTENKALGSKAVKKTGSKPIKRQAS